VRSAITLSLYIAIGINPAAGQLPNVLPYAMFSPESIRQQTAAPPVLKDFAGQPRLDVQKVVVITRGEGGVIREHHRKYAVYAREKTKVQIIGGCYSACTLITAYLNKDQLCIAEGAFFAFHAARTASTGENLPYETERMYWEQPMHIRDWIDRNGGWQMLPLNGFWTMYDRDLWAMGYPRCQ